METTLRGQIRTGRGKGPARQTRFAGQVPAILYGRGIEPVPLLVDGREMLRSLHTPWPGRSNGIRYEATCFTSIS
jgi:large subunit ribosomal protein L25